MPLQAELPAIDDRRFGEILDELRTRVPRYTPEWTDLNDNDPGMALAQLFAWLTEMLIFRLGRVPEQNYVKFLQLLGIELRPAMPAHTEITFPVQGNGGGPSTVDVPPRTQIAATPDDGGAPIVFETDRALVALCSELLSVQAHSGFDYTDLSARNRPPENGAPDEAGFLPFGGLAGAGAALLLGFNPAQPLPPVDLDLTFFLVERPGGVAAFACDLPETRFVPPATLVWECWNGQEWLRLTLVKDETRGLTRSGHVVLRRPPAATLQPVVIGRVAEPRFWLRGRIERDGYESPPVLYAIRTNTVPATQAETSRDEVLGGSDGLPNQSFRLANTPVLAGSLELVVDEGAGYEAWREVPDLLGSGSDDAHYTLNRTTGEVRFGDGARGRIPVANVNNVEAGIVAREYRAGGGRRGNVPAGALRASLTTLAGIDEARIGNLRPATGGQDEEALAEAKRRAPLSLQSKCRAVTAHDFETLAQQAANVKRAKALPLTHPDFPGARVPGVVTVIVVPDAPVPNPLPSEGTLRTVCAFLDQRRLLTTEVHVAPPTYRQVTVTVDLVAEETADLAEVRAGVEQTLLDYFHPLRGGEDGQGWPFGGDIFYSRVYGRIFAQPGVRRIERATITLDGEEAAPCQDVAIPSGALLYSTGHDVRPTYDVEREG